MKRNADYRKTFVSLLLVLSISGCASTPKPSNIASDLVTGLTIGVLESAFDSVVHRNETPEERRRRKLLKKDREFQKRLRPGCS